MLPDPVVTLARASDPKTLLYNPDVKSIKPLFENAELLVPEVIFPGMCPTTKLAAELLKKASDNASIDEAPETFVVQESVPLPSVFNI